MSLRWKLALAMALMSSLATIAFGVASYRSTEQRLMAEVDRSLVALEPMVVQSSLGEATVGLERFRAQIVARDGALIRTTFPEPIPVPGLTSRAGAPAPPPAAGGAGPEFDVLIDETSQRSSFDTIETSDGTYRVRTTQFGNAAISVGRPLEETERVLHGLRNRTLVLIGLVALLAAAIGFWLADLITAPLRRLTAAADGVAATGRPQSGVALIAADGDPAPDASSGDEVRRLGAGFRRMLDALARSQEEQERLVQDAGHELRTPLTSLRTNLDTLRRYPDISAAQRDEIIADLHAETEELSELVDEIVAVAGGGLSGESANEVASTFDLTAAARTIGERYARRAGRPVEVRGEPVEVTAERTGVQRAISCLLDNTRKFDPSGAPIEVTVTGSGGWADVRVRDRGPGIAAAELERVFDRFHRADDARTLPGSGLGLAIVKAVAERHGGTASAANAADGGAVVGFTLPAVRPAS